MELALAHLPSATLLDDNMPEMSGREVQGILRKDPRTGNIPIIALSANAAPNAVESSGAAGVFPLPDQALCRGRSAIGS